MATFPIRLFGDPVLKQRAREVEELDGALAALVDSMYETMDDAAGLGLAAPQVGVQRRLFTYALTGDEPATIVNPEIVESSGEWTYDEGCLSVPGLQFEIVRPQLVTLRGIDLDGTGGRDRGRRAARSAVPARDRPSRRGAAARPPRSRRPEARAPSLAGARPAERRPAQRQRALIVADAVRLVYLGTPADAVAPLRALVAGGHEVALVVTQPDRRRTRGRGDDPSPVKQAAIELGLRVVTPNKAREIVDDVRATGAELGVVVAFGQLLPKSLLDALPGGFVNLHFSLLPRWRGAAPGRARPARR